MTHLKVVCPLGLRAIVPVPAIKSSAVLGSVISIASGVHAPKEKTAEVQSAIDIFFILHILSVTEGANIRTIHTICYNALQHSFILTLQIATVTA